MDGWRYFLRELGYGHLQAHEVADGSATWNGSHLMNVTRPIRIASLVVILSSSGFVFVFASLTEAVKDFKFLVVALPLVVNRSA